MHSSSSEARFARSQQVSFAVAMCSKLVLATSARVFEARINQSSLTSHDGAC